MIEALPERNFHDPVDGIVELGTLDLILAALGFYIKVFPGNHHAVLSIEPEVQSFFRYG
jgi:hypothetical protein